MTLHIYNTLSRQKEKFKPMHDPDVRFYACGPTVYNYAHIGNLSTYLVSDIALRILRFLGYRVDALMNITDIDDKTIRESQKAGKTLTAFTQEFTEIFNEDMKRLGIDSFDRQKPISELIPEMIAIIQALLDKGYAYLADDGSIYYSIKKFRKYGNLAHLDMKGMKHSVRIDNDEYEKDDVADFALWKAYEKECDGLNKWDARFKVQDSKGNITEVDVPGRPGWHIECSACNRWGFNDQIDIHMGACDLIFPHHQNEIAQSEAASGKEFCRYWAHAGHLLVDNKKMAKSAGNFYRLADLVEKSDLDEAEVYRALRMMRLQNSYRDSFNFTFDKLTSAHNTLANIDTTIKRLALHQAQESDRIHRDIRNFLQESMMAFVSFLEDDFDTVQALTVLFDLLTYINTQIDTHGLTSAEVGAFRDLLESFNEVLVVLDFSSFDESLDIPAEIQDLLDQRTAAKIEKRYGDADKIRDQIESQGWTIVDEKTGSRVEKR